MHGGLWVSCQDEALPKYFNMMIVGVVGAFPDVEIAVADARHLHSSLVSHSYQAWASTLSHPAMSSSGPSSMVEACNIDPLSRGIGVQN